MRVPGARLHRCIRWKRGKDKGKDSKLPRSPAPASSAEQCFKAAPFARVHDALGGADDSDWWAQSQQARWRKRLAEMESDEMRSLVNSNTLVPTPSVYIPAWMAEAYIAYRDFRKRVERLWLPETSMQTKLPYYSCAPNLCPRGSGCVSQVHADGCRDLACVCACATHVDTAVTSLCSGLRGHSTCRTGEGARCH